MQAERRVLAQLASGALNKEYLPITGNAEFCDAARRLLFGDALVASLRTRCMSLQTLSGTGALRVAMDLLARTLGKQTNGTGETASQCTLPR